MAPSDDQLARIVGLCQIQLPAMLESMIGRNRWFADKGRGEPVFEIADIGAERVSAGLLILAIVDVRFISGEPSRYFIPLLISEHNRAIDEPVLLLNCDGAEVQIADAVGNALSSWLLRFIADSRSIRLSNGLIEGTSSGVLDPARLDETALPARVEQSNSSLIFDTMIAKVYRRLSPGISPDVEVGDFFARQGDQSPTPRLLGSLAYRTQDAEYTLAMLQDKIDFPQDGWSLLLDALRHGLPLAASIGDDLGALTATMHLALSNETDNPRFSVERAISASIESWRASTRDLAVIVITALRSLGDDVDQSTRQLAHTLVENEHRLLSSIEGYRELEGGALMRVHGDYHLGQVLRGHDGKWWVVDFEGEPRRPIAERIRKTSPLKDTAGMLRSFSYARAAAQRNDPASAESLAQWEARTRVSFIDSYMRNMKAERPALLPSSDTAFGAALAAWELDKALYEVEYELSSRPDWLWVPLQALVEQTGNGK